MASFGPVAPHYDVLMSAVPYRMWVGYYQLLLAQQGQTPKTLLDVCCGTGTLSTILCREGYEVAGIDLSEPMIVEARKKATEQRLDIEFIVGDVCDFDLGRRFDAAFSFFDSLNYIADFAALRKAIQNLSRHIKKGGSFIFDLNTAYAFEEKMFDQRDLRKRAPIRYQWKGDYDPTSRVIEVTMEFVRDGERFQEKHVQRAHSDDEIRSLLQEAGFEEVHCYDSYTLDPPRERSDRVHYTAIRA